MALTRATSGAVLLPPLHVLESEPTLDAEMSARHVVVRGRADLHDGVVLDVKLQLAPDPAVGADRVRDGLSIFVPRAGGAHVVFAREHQRARRTDADAVAAVHAR